MRHRNTTSTPRRSQLRWRMVHAAIPGLILILSASAALALDPSVVDRPLRFEIPSDAALPPGTRVIEGDILVPEGDGLRATYTTVLWPGGIVPFQFDANVTPANQNAMLAAMTLWENVANVDFVPRNGEADFIHIQDAAFNASFVGRVGGGQVVSIFNWNFQFVMAHELGHALAYWHEQSRLDRDNFVQIEWNNICDCCGPQGDQPCDFNFDFRPGPGGEYGPYDFDSVMHYSQCAFSTCANCGINPANCRTVTVLPPNDVAWQNGIGQLTHLSTWDQRVMSFLYPQANWVFVDNTFAGTELGSFLAPYRQFTTGASNVPAGGAVWILRPAAYSAGGVYAKAMTVQAPLGGVVISN